MRGGSKRLDSSLKVSVYVLPSSITEEETEAQKQMCACKSCRDRNQGLTTPPRVLEPSGQSVTLHTRATGRGCELLEGQSYGVGGAHPGCWVSAIPTGDRRASGEAVGSLATTLLASCL